jgi:hypothetical protein
MRFLRSGTWLVRPELRRAALVGMALAAGGGAAVAFASAGDGTATTLGDVSEHVVSAAYGNQLSIQALDQSGLRTYAVPAEGGVITSWSLHLEQSTAAGDVTLKALAPQAVPNTYIITGEAVGHVEIGLDRTVTFSSRMPVQGGERLALQTPNSTIHAGTINGGTGDIRVVGGATTLGSSVTSLPYASSAHLSLQAVVEPDADRDGYGDLTQDDCVADASRQTGPCGADLHLALTAAPATIELKDVTVLKAAVTATGGPVTSPTVTFALPSGLQLITAGGTGGDCTGTTSVTCPLGDLARGGRGTVVLTARGVAAGAQAAAASVAAASPDPAPADNAVTAAVTVVAPPGGDKTPPGADKTPPSLALVLPACPKTLPAAKCTKRRAARSRWTALQLTAVDTGGAGIASVQVAVAKQRGKKLDVLTGTAFKPSTAKAFLSAWRTAVPSGKTFIFKLPKLAPGTYLLRLRATDKAGNVSKVTTRTLHLR